MELSFLFLDSYLETVLIIKSNVGCQLIIGLDPSCNLSVHVGDKVVWNYFL